MFDKNEVCTSKWFKTKAVQANFDIFKAQALSAILSKQDDTVFAPETVNFLLLDESHASKFSRIPISCFFMPMVFNCMHSILLINFRGSNSSKMHAYNNFGDNRVAKNCINAIWVINYLQFQMQHRRRQYDTQNLELETREWDKQKVRGSSGQPKMM